MPLKTKKQNQLNSVGRTNTNFKADILMGVGSRHKQQQQQSDAKNKDKSK